MASNHTPDGGVRSVRVEIVYTIDLTHERPEGGVPEPVIFAVQPKPEPSPQGTAMLGSYALLALVALLSFSALMAGVASDQIKVALGVFVLPSFGVLGFHAKQHKKSRRE